MLSIHTDRFTIFLHHNIGDCKQKIFRSLLYGCIIVCTANYNVSGSLIPYSVSGSGEYFSNDTYSTGYFSGSCMFSDVAWIYPSETDIPGFFGFKLLQCTIYFDGTEIISDGQGDMSFIIPDANSVANPSVFGNAFSLGSLCGEYCLFSDKDVVENWDALNSNGYPILPEKITWGFCQTDDNILPMYGLMTFSRAVPEPSLFSFLTIGFLGLVLPAGSTVFYKRQRR